VTHNSDGATHAHSVRITRTRLGALVELGCAEIDPECGPNDPGPMEISMWQGWVLGSDARAERVGRRRARRHIRDAHGLHKVVNV
jgi:hypothetical protein